MTHWYVVWLAPHADMHDVTLTCMRERSADGTQGGCSMCNCLHLIPTYTTTLSHTYPEACWWHILCHKRTHTLLHHHSLLAPLLPHKLSHTHIRRSFDGAQGSGCVIGLRLHLCFARALLRAACARWVCVLVWVCVYTIYTRYMLTHMSIWNGVYIRSYICVYVHVNIFYFVAHTHHLCIYTLTNTQIHNMIDTHTHMIVYNMYAGCVGEDGAHEYSVRALHTFVHIHIRTCTCTNTHTHIYIHMRTHTHTNYAQWRISQYTVHLFFVFHSVL